jgi:aminoglycoside/choline kinase family phosphotransferase
MKLSKDFKEIKGDASFRKFYRNTKKNSVIVFANREKIKNLLIYDSINKILIKNDIIAPKLLSQDYKNNYIEIQYLGNKTIYQKFSKNKKNQYLIFKKAINVLNKIQLVKDKKIKNFINKFYLIKDYKNNILLDEAKLFSDWYVPKKLNKKNISYYKIPVDYEIRGNFLGYIKFKRELAKSNKMLNFDKETIKVVPNDKTGAILASGVLTIVGLTDEFF